jgi:hypothetical protein
MLSWDPRMKLVNRARAKEANSSPTYDAVLFQPTRKGKRTSSPVYGRKKCVFEGENPYW